MVAHVGFFVKLFYNEGAARCRLQIANTNHYTVATKLSPRQDDAMRTILCIEDHNCRNCKTLNHS